MSAVGAYLIESAAMLAIVGLLAAALVSLSRRSPRGGSSSSLELYGRLPLDARKAVFLVRVGEQVLVLGSSEAGLRLLSTLPAASVPRPTAPPTLSQALSRRIKSLQEPEE